MYELKERHRLETKEVKERHKYLLSKQVPMIAVDEQSMDKEIRGLRDR